MKFTKQTMYSLLIVLTIFLTISCSDTTDINELEDNQVDLTTTIVTDEITQNRQLGVPSCDNPPISLDLLGEYIITYHPGVTAFERNIIRTNYSSLIHCVDYNYDPTNSSTEKWFFVLCKYGRTCKPKGQGPQDPDFDAEEVK